jgi:dTDP-4-amino-4,6-dideoxygalactose transaminase
MFSFGPIKTNTALAGAVLEVRQPELLRRMKEMHSAWPRQSNWNFLKRVVKYLALKKVATRPALATLGWIARLRGTDHDTFVSGAARGFPGSDFFAKIRRQPAEALVKLLTRKLVRFDASRARARQNCGQALAARLARRLPVPGIDSIRQTWWVLGVLVEEPDVLVQMLWREGFDASRGSSLKPVGERQLIQANRLMDHLVFLPFDLAMPAGELDRMIQLVLDSNALAPAWTTPAVINPQKTFEASSPNLQSRDSRHK